MAFASRSFSPSALPAALTVILVLASSLYAAPAAPLQTPKFVYVVNEVSSSISAYAINAATGELAAVPGSPFQTPRMPHWLAVNPSGSFAYVVTDDSSVAQLVTFSIDRNTGALAAVNTAALPSPSFSVPKVDPSGRFLLLASSRMNSISVYELNHATGVPSLLGTSHTGNLPVSSNIDPLGKFVYLAGNSTSVTGYSLDSTKGTLTPVPGSPFTVRKLTPLPLKRPITQLAVIHPSGNFLYVTDPVTRTISIFGIDRSSGSLKMSAGSPVSVQGVTPFEAAAEVHGKYLYFGDSQRGAIAAFSISSSGTLTPVHGSPFLVPFTGTPAHGGGTAIVTDPSGRFLYATSAEQNEIVGFTIDAGSGALVPMAGGPQLTGTHPFRIVVRQ